MEVYRRSSWLLLLLGVSLLASALQGVQGEAETEGPSESDCRPYIEKALKGLEVDADALKIDGDSREDVPTVEITTDDPDHLNDGDDNDTHETNDSVESVKADQKPQSDKKESEETSAESPETAKSAEDTNSDEKDSHENSDTIDQKSKETEEDKKESVEDKETQDESQEKLKESSEDTKEVSQEITIPESKESNEEAEPPSEEDNKTDSKEDNRSDTPSKEDKSEEDKIVKVEISKTEAEKPKEKKVDVKNKEDKEEKVKIVVHPSKKGNPWWSFDSDEVIFAESQPKVAQPVKIKNKWWKHDSDEVIEEKTPVKSEPPPPVEPPRKKNKWWHYSDEDDSEESEPIVQKKLESPKVDDSWKKDNKWWNTEDSSEKKDEPIVKVKKEKIEQKPKIVETAAPVKKNKWWNVESGESEEKPVEIKVVEQKPVVEEAKKKNKWWNVEESNEKESGEKIEKPKAKIIREAPIIKMTIKEPVKPKIVKEEAIKVKATKEEAVPKNKWWNVEESEEVKKEDIIIKRYVETLKEESEEDDSVEESGPAPEEELSTLDFEIPTDLRSRDHVEHLLRLDRESSESESVINRIAAITLKELKKLYETAIKPLEILYKYRDLSNRHFGDAEIFSKPLILFMGPWSGGKSSIINYLLDNEYNETSLRTGAEPSPAYFNLLMYGEEYEILDGTQLAADFTFSGLQKFGQGLEERLRGIKLPSKLLEKVNIVEIPGILEVRKQVSRVFPFNDACQWFIDRADIIFLVYDPSKLDVGPETEAILDQLKGREHQTRIILNKADQVKPEELMRVQGALIWNISPLMSSAQPPAMYTTSLWSKPYETWAPVRLLHAQERAFLRDLRSAIEKRIDNKIASARRFAVRVRNHAKMVDCYLTTYYNHKSVFGSRKQVADEIIEHPQNYHIYEGLSTLTNISRYDLPDPEVYKDFFKLNALYDFQQLSATCTYFRGCPINRLDVAIAYDLPELIGKHKRMIETALVEANNPPAPGS